MRTERDSMGAMEVPESALYGASTQRAVLNFPVSGQRMPLPFLKGLALLKWAAARANGELGSLEPSQSELICKAAEEVMAGRHDDQFPLDVFQTGSGTSSNMNMNEVLANRCSQLAGHPVGSREPVHPNDHCNHGQSSNDIVPSALHVSLALVLRDDLRPALVRLRDSLEEKAVAFDEVIKIGRTHLMDATPVTMGMVFSGYAAQLSKAIRRCDRSIAAVAELAIGGTAVGTGLNSPGGFAGKVCELVSERTGIEFREADNHFEAQAARDDAVEVAGNLVTMASALGKIANDIRLLGSGTRCGIGELKLPATQPGSSIMPGKVNPVMSEMLIQVCHYVRGMASVVGSCGQDGQFELNATIPLVTASLHNAIACLANGCQLFATRCVDGLEADADQCRRMVDRSLMLITALAPRIGYDQATTVAKVALQDNKSLREVVLEKKLLPEAELDAALDPRSML